MGPALTYASDGALVALSGGQDSATALAWALERFEHVETVGFEYGQRHAVELQCRPRVRDALASLKLTWKMRLGPDHLVALDLIGQISGQKIKSPQRALTEPRDRFATSSRYIPGRNMLMLAMCGSVAYRRQIRTIVYGASETEYSGYPDCQDVSIKAVNVALNISTGLEFNIECPLMWRDKAGVWKLALELGGEEMVSLIVEATHTCYAGVRDIYWDWGFGCGECPACRLRAKGWQEFRASTYRG